MIISVSSLAPGKGI